MATVKQLDDQIGKLQIQRDALIKQVNTIETQMANIRKQLATSNDQQKASLNTKLATLQAQKNKITGAPSIQAESNEPLEEDGEVVGGEGTADDSAATTTSNVATFPFRAFVPKKIQKMNVKKESLGNFIDKMGE